jgi:hypothetical protein
VTLTGLLIDAAWKSVRAVAESVSSAALSPYALAQTTRPLSTTAMLTAGVR